MSHPFALRVRDLNQVGKRGRRHARRNPQPRQVVTAQGDGIDDFAMSGGTITGAFEDGDHGLMTGGSIGRVDMKLDNNLFDMRGGTVVGNFVTGFGDDTILVSGTSFIGGNLSVSGGADIIVIKGGRIAGEIRMSAGNDQFEWNGAGQLDSAVLLAGDNDTALLKNLTEAIVAPTPVVDGGTENDTLTFDNSQVSTPQRYQNWEIVNLDNNSSLSLGGTFTLGDAATGTGTMNVERKTHVESSCLLCISEPSSGPLTSKSPTSTSTSLSRTREAGWPSIQPLPRPLGQLKM